MRRLREIAAGVLVATAERGTTTSTVVAADDGGCLVIDPAMTAADVAGLAADLADGGLRPRLGFATHPHWDHLLWSGDLGAVPRYAAPAAVRLAEHDRDEIVSYVRDSVPGHDLELIGRLVPLPAGLGPHPLGRPGRAGNRARWSRTGARRGVHPPGRRPAGG
jgi:hydroxyacylglutathione hydrolase